jgi:hypothetical protein
MKNSLSKNQKIGAAASFLLGMATVLVQACGSGSGSGAAAASTSTANSSVCGINSVGQYSCTSSGSTTGSTLYSACGSSYPTQIATEALGANSEVSSVTATQASDGASVCQVVFTQLVSYQGARAFLGPNAGTNTSDVLNTGVYLYQYDQFAAYATGEYGANSATSITDTACSGGGCTDLYGEVTGAVGYFPIYGQVQIMAYNGSYLYVGVNQGVGSSGEMALNMEVQIERCVDANGNYHQCANQLVPSFEAAL